MFWNKLIDSVIIVMWLNVILVKGKYYLFDMIGGYLVYKYDQYFFMMENGVIGWSYND